MESNKTIYLDVKTVQAFDPETKLPHTAYTVSFQKGEETALASAWTLRDAVRLFRKIYSITEKTAITLKRPFKPQFSSR